MLKQIKINEKWGTYDFVAGLYKTEPNARIKIRLLAVKLAYEGKKSEDIGEIILESGSTVRAHLNRYNARGYDGLKDLAHPVPDEIMNEAEMVEIDKALQQSPRTIGIENSNWTGPLLKNWISQRFGKTVSRTTSYNILNRLGYSKTRPKRKSRKADPDKEDEFRKEIAELISSKDENTVILYEDEAIFTSEPTITEMWTKKGHQAIIETSGETRKRVVVYGAVNPENGDLFEQFSNAGNTKHFKEFMLTVSAAIGSKTAIMPLDNAKYHHFKGIDEWWNENIPNIKRLYLPSYCSELNAIEHLWKNIRSAVTHNTLFDIFNSLISGIKSHIYDLKLFPEKLTKLCKFIY
jgi:transposase